VDVRLLGRLVGGQQLHQMVERRRPAAPRARGPGERAPDLAMLVAQHRGHVHAVCHR